LGDGILALSLVHHPLEEIKLVVGDKGRVPEAGQGERRGAWA
jgi:hypothetical protein